MSVRVVVGLQWGDEGKGKIVDLLADFADVVVRFQGGNNAGHTIVIDGVKSVLNIVPSGVFQPDTKAILADGVVIDPSILLQELNRLIERDASISQRVMISDRANLIMPYHKLIDKVREEGHSQKIGTTHRGIGPTYEDLVGRCGISFNEFNPRFKSSFMPWFAELIAEKNAILKKVYSYSGEALNAEAIYQEYQHYYEQLKCYLTDTAQMIRSVVAQGQNVLFEGAQGCMLDVLHGSYPYVTSSNTIAAAASVNSGLSPQHIGGTVGITKAYTTRVGEGVFPTEIQDDGLNHKLQQAGNEFGATTGRPRRVGWLDLCVLRHAVALNGVNKLVITKIDILDELDEIMVATAYIDDEGQEHLYPPPWMGRHGSLTPQYKTLKGWKSSTKGVNDWNKLPQNAQEYVEFIATACGVPISIVSTGQDRNEVIKMGNIW